MRDRLLRTSFALVLAHGAAIAAAQGRLTEQFIPIGRSPGLSYKVTVIGEIQSRDGDKRTITVAGPSGPRSAQITDRTRIWLDRSSMKASNVEGTFDDLKVGRRVECKFEEAERAKALEWIKVEVTS
jgi:hypothetical protein